MTHYRYLIGLLLAIQSCILLSQTTNISAPPAPDKQQPVLFGTNVNLESSPGTKGVQLGMGAHQEDTYAKKKKRDAANSR